MLSQKARNKASNITTHKGGAEIPFRNKKPSRQAINRYGGERKKKEEEEDKNTHIFILKMNLRQRRLFLLFAILGSTCIVVDGRRIAARAMVPERRQESAPGDVTEVRFATPEDSMFSGADGLKVVRL